MTSPHEPPSTPGHPAQNDAQAPTSAATPEQRPANEVEHLFRHSLRQGRINPLMHVILAYRASGSGQAQP